MPLLRPPTARSERISLSQQGFSGQALNYLVNKGAAARHSARVLATLEAVFARLGVVRPEENVVLGDRPSPYELPLDVLAQAWGLLQLDLGGVGGPGGMGGPSGATSRMPWASLLGAGRWHAGDGAAYRAAAEEASIRLGHAIQFASLVVDIEGNLAVSYASGMPASNVVPVPAQAGELAWWIAEAKRQLTHFSAMMPFDEGSKESALRWGTLLNKVDAAIDFEAVVTDARVRFLEPLSDQRMATAKAAKEAFAERSGEGPWLAFEALGLLLDDDLDLFRSDREAILDALHPERQAHDWIMWARYRSDRGVGMPAWPGVKVEGDGDLPF